MKNKIEFKTRDGHDYIAILTDLHHWMVYERVKLSSGRSFLYCVEQF